MPGSRQLAKTKNGYQIMIINYNQRKKEYKIRLPREKFLIRRERINKKIATIQKAIRRITKRELILKMTRLAVISYCGVDVKIIRKRYSDIENKARYSFFKYCIEAGVQGVIVAKFLKIYEDTPTEYRREFTKSFEVNNSNRDFYHSISSYIKQYKK